MNINLIAKRVAEEISDKHRFSVNFMPTPESTFQGLNDNISFSQQIEENHGIFAMIVKKAFIRVRVQKNQPSDNTSEYRYWVKVDLDYEHQDGGANGKTIGTLWLNDAYEIVESKI